MKIFQKKWSPDQGWEPGLSEHETCSPNLILLFGSASPPQQNKIYGELKQEFSHAHILGCSTAGEIHGTQVFDGTIVVTAIQFERTPIEGTRVKIKDFNNSLEVGKYLADSLSHHQLKHVFVLSDGLNVNGSDLVKGLTSRLPPEVSVTGGLSGDGARFKETLVLWDNPPEENTVAALGLYGKSLRIGYGSLGGWDSFGPERLVTKSKGNILYEVDNKSALDLYKKYLGEHAQGLPATGLLFPLSLRTSLEGTAVVRTILSVNEKDQSMTFAGDLPEGAYVRLMKANFDRLIDGSVGAAKSCFQKLGTHSPDLAILISCVGRKLV